MRFDSFNIKLELHDLASGGYPLQLQHARKVREAALEALAYIRHLEGELRRNGFTDYNERETEIG